MYRLEKLTDAFHRYGIKSAYGYILINKSLFPSPIARMEKPSRVPSYEVDELIKAKISGASDVQIKELIERLLASRKDISNLIGSNPLPKDKS